MERLRHTEYVATAFAESASGPGWANKLVWVIVCDRLDGSLRRISIQPDEQSDDMRMFHAVNEAAHAAMTGAAERLLKRERTSARMPQGSVAASSSVARRTARRVPGDQSRG